MEKNAKLVPKRRFKEFQNSDAWEQREFGEMVIRNSTMAVCNSGLPSVEYEDIVSGQGVLNKDIREKVAVKTGIRFDPYDVLFGKLRPYLKNWFLPSFSGVAVGDFWVMKPSEIDSRYLYYLIQTTPFQVAANQSTGTKMPRADWSLVSKTSFYLPKNQAEQARIGQRLQAIDNLITLHQRKLEKTKSLKAAFLSEMFPFEGQHEPKRRFIGFTGAWEQCKLGEVVDVCSGRDYKQLSEGDIPVYGTGGYMLSVNAALSYDKDAIGIGRKGTIDKPYILNAPFWTVDTLFYAIPRACYNLDFVYGIFQNIDWRQKDESTGVPSLSKISINSVEVKAPKFSEQKNIGLFFKTIDNLITLHQRKLEKLQNIKKAYLNEMFI